MSPKGFTLIEVTLALGIAGFALLAIFGLLPVGLQSFRGAMDATAEAQIVQQIVSQAQLTPYANLASFPKTYYFDDEGQGSDYTGKALVATSPFLKYTATVTVVNTTVLPSANSNPYIATLEIKVKDLARPAVSGNHTVQLANLGI